MSFDTNKFKFAQVCLSIAFDHTKWIVGIHNGLLFNIYENTVSFLINLYKISRVNIHQGLGWIRTITETLCGRWQWRWVLLLGQLSLSLLKLARSKIMACCHRLYTDSQSMTYAVTIQLSFIVINYKCRLHFFLLCSPSKFQDMRKWRKQ